MAITDDIAQLVAPAIEAQGLFLEEVQLVSPGKHRIITCIVDGPQSLNLDQVTVVTKIISELLDSMSFLGDLPFTLEVTSPGVDRPLTKARHFTKNTDRLLKVTQVDGEIVIGRILSSSDSSVTLLIEVKKESVELVINFDQIKRAVVEIEFNRKSKDAN